MGDIRADAEQAGRRVENLLRALPRHDEPAVVGRLRILLGENDDFRVHAVGDAAAGPWLIYLETLVDAKRLWNEVEQPVLSALGRDRDGPVLADLWPTASHAETVEQLCLGLTKGRTAVVTGRETGEWLLYDASDNPKRAVAEPTTEQTIVGPKEGFVEDLKTNLALMRKWFPDPSFHVDFVEVGRRSHTQVAVTYLDDVVRPGLVPLILKGLSRIDTDTIRTTWQIAEYLTAGSLTPFPLGEPTERPDRAAVAVSNGRVAILVEHSPFGLLLPTTFFEFQKDAEDALPGPVVTTFIRAMRQIGSLMAVVAPGLVVALLGANPGPLRPDLALALEVTRVGLPYPVFTEMLVLMLVVDVFSEVTSQAPGGVGNALSIVGTLIIGEISVRARLASELVMIVAAATAMGSFLTLRYQFSYALRIWKYPILILSGITGLFGWVAGVLLLVLHLASLKSAGVPYLAPFGPLHLPSVLNRVVSRPSRPMDVARPQPWKPADPDKSGFEESQPDRSEERPS